MRVLMLPAYYRPEQAASSYLWENINEALINNGLDLLVYTPTPCRGVDEATRKEYCAKKKEMLKDGHWVVNRFAMYKEGKNPIMRTLRYMLCGLKQYWYGVTVKDIDVLFIVSTPPIQGAIGALIKKWRKVRMVYNLQDIFPDSLVGTGLAKKGGMLWNIGRVIENFTYRNADKIIVISEDFKKNIMAKGVPEEKIEVVYNWVDEQAVVDVPRSENTLFGKYGLSRDKFYITYSGNVGLTQNMDMLLEVAKDLQVKKDIHFVIIGEGAYKKQVEEIIASDGIRNVTLLPFQPYEDISKVFSLGNVGVVISKPGVGANSVPSKTWSILSSSRPVLASFDENELKDIVRDNNCGIFIKAGDKEAFKKAILELYADKELCADYGKNGRKFIMANLTRAIGTQKYVDVIKAVVKK